MEVGGLHCKQLLPHQLLAHPGLPVLIGISDADYMAKGRAHSSGLVTVLVALPSEQPCIGVYLCILQLGLQVLHVHVLVAVLVSLAQADPINDGGMVQLI